MKRMIVAAVLAASMLGPIAARAASVLPVQPRAVVYAAAFVGSTARPLVGEYLDGTMRLTIYPSGIIAGTYLPQDGSPFSVSGGLDANGKVWLLLGQTIVTGELQPDGTIAAYSAGPSFQDLKFTAKPATH
jgi:hypothetical protein